jgi:FkbM family methyltransferase
MITDAEDPHEVVPQLWGDARGKVAWDIGANTGQGVGLLLGQGFQRVLAFEPSLESFEVLARKFHGDERVLTFALAMGEAPGTLVLQKRVELHDHGQLVSAEIPVPTAPVVDAMKQLPYGPVVENRAVPCSTIDWYREQYGIPDFIAVDVEGGEMQVMRGARETLKRNARWLVEFHVAPHAAWLRTLFAEEGYATELVRHPHYPPKSLMWYTHGWVKAWKLRM